MPYREPTRDALEARLRALLAERGELDAAIARTRRMLRPIRVRDGVVRLLAMTLWGWLAIAVTLAILVAIIPPPPKQSRVDSTRTDAQSVRSAAVMYVSENAAQCPLVEDLSEGGYLDRSRRTTDAWDHPYVILCGCDDVVVRSAGPDGVMGTEDDIQ